MSISLRVNLNKKSLRALCLIALLAGMYTVTSCTSETDKLINRQSEVLQADPNNVTALVLRAEGFKDKNENAKALIDLNRAIDLAPESARAYLIRSEVYFQDRAYENALTDANKALTLNAELSKAYAIRGQARVALEQDFAQALVDLDDAIKKGENTPEVHRYRGKALVRLNRKSDAQLAYQEALSLLATASTGSGTDSAQGRKMVEIATEAIAQTGANAIFYESRGEGYRLQKQYASAIDDFTEVIRLNPQSAGAFQKRADAYYATGKCEQAVADLRTACRLGKSSLCDEISLGCNAPTPQVSADLSVNP
jgi:tetratricopeptide (TPR) repeat protein